jgi:nitronate monooxygenase
MPGRAIRNPFVDTFSNGRRKRFNCVYHCITTCNSQDSPYCIAMALLNAKQGKLKHGFAFAGANAYRVDKIVSVRELIASLQVEFDQANG